MRFIALSLFLLFSIGLSAQLENLRNFTDRDGLCSNVVYRCYQDKDGFMWFATKNGVCRYDGYHFDVFTTEDGLISNEVFHIKQDSKGRIWFMTLRDQMCYYLNGVIHNPKNDSLLASINFNGFRCNDMYEDKQGRIWFMLGGMSMAMLHDDKLSTFDLRGMNSESSLKNGFQIMEAPYVYEDVSGKLLVYIYDAIWEFNYDKNALENKRKTDVLITSSFLYSGRNYQYLTSADELVLKRNEKMEERISMDVKEQLFMAFKDGEDMYVSTRNHELFFYSANDKYTRTETTSLISYFFKDREENLWICSLGGGVYFKSAGQKNCRIWRKDELHNQSMVYSLLKHSSGDLLFGLNQTSIGVLSQDGLYFIKDNLSTRSDLRVTGFLENDDVVLAFTDDHFVTLKKDPKGRWQSGCDLGCGYIGTIKDIAVDKSRQFWWTSHSGLFSSYLKKGNLKFNRLEHYFGIRMFGCLIDKQDRLWCSSINGLEVFDEPFDSLPLIAKMNEQINLKMRCFKDSMVISNAEGLGLIFYNGLQPYDTLLCKQDLNCSNCSDFFVQDNIIWCATDKGIRRIKYTDALNVEMSSFVHDQGLPSQEVTTILFSDGFVYAGTADGMIKIPEESFLMNQELLPLYFRKISGTWGVSKNFDFVEVDYLNNNFLIEFSAINPSGYSGIRYQFSLDNDKEWIDINSGNLSLNGLSYGSHKVFIRLNSGGNNWSSPIFVNLSVRAPFVATIYFKILVVLLAMLFVGAIIFIIARRKWNQLRQLALVKAERERISADLHDDIGADLTRIALMTEVLKEKHAVHKHDELWDKLVENAKELRAKTDQIIWALNPSNDRMMDLAAYIHHYGMECCEASNIQFVFINNLNDEVMLSSLQRRNLFLVIKEAMNNSLKHSGTTSIELEMTLRGKELIFQLTDKGRGMNESVRRSGMRFMEKRIAEINGKFEIVSEAGAGVRIMVAVPIT